MKFTIVGAGYVGMSLAILLSRYHEVTLLDVDQERVNKINKRIPTIEDQSINDYLKDNPDCGFPVGTLDPELAYETADFIIVAVPTNYDPTLNHFDTSILDKVIAQANKINPNALIIIKSTIPIGFVSKTYDRLFQQGITNLNLVFSPEFLRENNSLKDNLYPSRIIVGVPIKSRLKESSNSIDYYRITTLSGVFANILADCSELKGSVDQRVIGVEEAESIKLFANTYLAMRVAYFNELDTYAELKGYDAKDIIEGVCLDQRIRTDYNNPSFGYGGYCLPKDTKQLREEFKNIQECLITAIVNSNYMRKNYIADQISRFYEKISSNLSDSTKTIGVYRLSMKSGSDNYRDSSIIDVIRNLKSKGFNIVIFDPVLNITNKEFFDGVTFASNLDHFKKLSDIIITNRFDKSLEDVKHKTYTRDIYGCN